jgi:hypothetical protein
VFTGAVAGTSQPAPTPEPIPGVNQTYDGTFRILASDDVDPGRGTSTVHLYEYDNGSISDATRTVSTRPVQLVDDNIRPADALAIAAESDMYHTSLSGHVTVPYRDRWYTLAEWTDTWGEQDLRIVPIYGADPSRATSLDGQYTVEVRNPNGWWDPVHGARVDRTTDGLSVTNPETALVHTADYYAVIDRKRDIIASLLRYSETAPNGTVARETAIVPMDEGREVFPTTAGGTMTPAWTNGSHEVIRDAYVGVLDVTPGAWYRGRYVTPAAQVNAHVPWDYRIQPPANYSANTTCTVGSVDHTATRWAEYRVIDSNASVRNVTAGPIAMQQWGPGAWTTLNFTSPLSEPRPLPVGAHTLSADLRVDVEVEARWGVTSAACPSWARTETVTRSLTVTRSVPIETVDSENLTVDVHVYDRPGEDVVAVNWTGRQGLAAGAAAWEVVEIQVGGKTLYVTAPWRFFSVARNTHVETRRANGTVEVPASHSINGTYPALLHYRMSPATVQVVTEQAADRRVWWEPTETVANGSIEATPLPATVVAPANAEPSPLYDRYAGVLQSPAVTTGENVSAQAVDVWGLPVTTNATVTRYERPVLILTTFDDTRLARVILQSGDGVPLRGREIHLEGADVPSVRTDDEGTATVGVTGPVIQARFAGDDWRTDRPRYFLPAQSAAVSSVTAVVGPIEVVGYLSDAVSNVLLFVEWVALGLFALVWLRYVRTRPI